MQIQFTGHNTDVTDALKAYTRDKFKRLARLADKITSIHITFNVDKLKHIAEAKVHLPGTEIHAHSEADSMYNAITSLVEKLIRQVKKHKDKHR